MAAAHTTFPHAVSDELVERIVVVGNDVIWKQCGERALSFPYRPVPAAALHRWHVRMHAVHRLVQGFFQPDSSLLRRLRQGTAGPFEKPPAEALIGQRRAHVVLALPQTREWILLPDEMLKTLVLPLLRRSVTHPPQKLGVLSDGFPLLVKAALRFAAGVSQSLRGRHVECRHDLSGISSALTLRRTAATVPDGSAAISVALRLRQSRLFT